MKQNANEIKLATFVVQISRPPQGIRALLRTENRFKISGEIQILQNPKTSWIKIQHGGDTSCWKMLDLRLRQCHSAKHDRWPKRRNQARKRNTDESHPPSHFEKITAESGRNQQQCCW